MSDNITPFKQQEEQTDNNILDEITQKSLMSIKEFTKDALAVVSTTPLFNEEEKKEFEKAALNMERAFKNNQIFRTTTEAMVSVLNDTKFPTPASKWFQCFREMNVHQNELVSLLYQYESMRQDIVILQSEISQMEEGLEHVKTTGDIKSINRYDIIITEAEIEKKRIKLSKLGFELKNMKRVADDRKREILMWSNILDQLEPLVDSEGVSKEDPNDHQKISYTARFLKQIVQHLDSGGDPSEIQNVINQLQASVKNILQNSPEDLKKVSKYLNLNEKVILIQSGVPQDLLTLNDIELKAIENYEQAKLEHQE